MGLFLCCAAGIGNRTLRFKKEWIEKRDHAFLRRVTGEWLLGF